MLILDVFQKFLFFTFSIFPTFFTLTKEEAVRPVKKIRFNKGIKENMSASTLQKHLESSSGKMKLQIKINDNRSTMLSVRWETDCTKVSLHRMFLSAPRNVMDELACYLQGKQKSIAPVIKAFIDDNIKKLDYSHTIDKSTLSSQGSFYNLKDLYDALNEEYFDNELNLMITWFGTRQQRNRTRITFGLYHDPLKLIKINRLLDSPVFPDYVVSFVIYHEMLHYVCPPYIDQNGLNKIHSKAFKAREKQFRHFRLAQKWIQDHQQLLFKDKLHGWS